jgi:hypothetical protein
MRPGIRWPDAQNRQVLGNGKFRVMLYVGDDEH